MTKELVLGRDEYKCQECDNVAYCRDGLDAAGGADGPLEKLNLCYRVSPEDGGNNSMGNLFTLCVQCIRRRGLEPIDGPYDWGQGQ